MSPYDLRSIVVPVQAARGWPAEIIPPKDRRHRWRLTSEREHRRWFRCTACGKRRSVTHLVSVLGAKMAQAELSMTQYLNVDLFARWSCAKLHCAP